jgi:hypothetical protein
VRPSRRQRAPVPLHRGGHVGRQRADLADGQRADGHDGTVTWAEIGRGITQIDAADPSWGSGATISGIRYMAIYKSTGTGSTSPLLWLVDFGSDQAVTSGTFTAVLAALGIEVFSTP